MIWLMVALFLILETKTKTFRWVLMQLPDLVLRTKLLPCFLDQGSFAGDFEMALQQLLRWLGLAAPVLEGCLGR